MSDNFQVTAGSGTTISSKDIGAGVQQQRIYPTHNDGTDTKDASPFPVKNVAFTAGGPSIYRSLSVVNVIQTLKGSAGQFYGGIVFNANAAVRYLKFYDAASPAVGTDTPVLTIPLEAQKSTHLSEFLSGTPFATAIKIAATTALADNDTGAPSANDIIVNLLYK